MFPIVERSQLAGLSPSHVFGGAAIPAVDETFRATMQRVYLPLAAQGCSPYNLWRIATAAYHHAALMRRLLGDTRRLTAVEIGSGDGMKSLGWAELFDRYIGVDIDPDRVEDARRHARSFGLGNTEFHCENAVSFVGRLPALGVDRIDLLILYAVVEHLTLPERQEILALASRVYDAGGAVLIDECPNRLSRFDSHSFHLPFTQWLPPELMRRYAEKHSRRDDLRAMINAAKDRETALFRAGVGVSFHEFDLFWPGFDEVVVGADGYDIEMLNLNPFTADDAALLDYFNELPVAAHRLFTKHLLSGVFGRNLAPVQPRAARLSTAAGYGGGRRQAGHSNWLAEVVLTNGGERLHLLPTDQALALTLVLPDEGELALREPGGELLASFDLGRLSRARLPIWHDRTTIALPPLPGGGELSFRGPDGAELRAFDPLRVG